MHCLCGTHNQRDMTDKNVILKKIIIFYSKDQIRSKRGNDAAEYLSFSYSLISIRLKGTE